MTDKTLAQLTAELADSEERFRQLAENIREVFWLGATGEGLGQNLYVSPAYADIWGKPVSSLRESPSGWMDAVHEEDRPAVRHAARSLEEPGRYDIEYRIRRPDGSIRWIHDRAFPVHDEQGNILRIAGIAQDITERKLIEQQVQHEQQLLQQFIALQEQERQTVVSDIHDGVLQVVIGAHLHLQSIDAGMDAEAIERKVNQVSALLQQAIEKGCRLMSDVRPMILDERGVIAAIEHLVAEDKLRQDLYVAFHHNVRFERLEPEREGVIYRIVQEALTNVKQHGNTDHAAIQLTQHDGTLHVEVRDRGIGFDVEAVPPQRLGLRGIRERARLFGGSAMIHSMPGEGTTIRVVLPITPGGRSTSNGDH